MKVALFGLAGIAHGKHNLKDPRLDQIHKLVEADKKTYMQVDILEDGNLEADVILTNHDRFPDLILKDLEFVETRLGRNPPEAERALLQKIGTNLEQERPLSKIVLSDQEREAISAHNFLTNRPIVVAEGGESGGTEELLLRAFKEAGFICFLTVGGKENRAWPVRKGPPHGKRPARSTPIFRKASSALRLSASKT